MTTEVRVEQVVCLFAVKRAFMSNMCPFTTDAAICTAACCCELRANVRLFICSRSSSTSPWSSLITSQAGHDRRRLEQQSHSVLKCSFEYIHRLNDRQQPQVMSNCRRLAVKTDVTGEHLDQQLAADVKQFGQCSERLRTRRWTEDRAS